MRPGEVSQARGGESGEVSQARGGESGQGR